jgi:hypothetical protein
MEKQDLKNLLENIYHLLAESAPPPTAEEPRGLVTPTVAPGTDAQSQTSFYDRSAQPSLPAVGPWNGGWGGAAVVWPPPTSALPPAGPGGMWISWTLDGGQISYYYVYPQSPVNGYFPAWGWYGSDYGFVQVVPDWGDGAS